MHNCSIVVIELFLMIFKASVDILVLNLCNTCIERKSVGHILIASIVSNILF